jgi:hypothetical protein
MIKVNARKERQARKTKLRSGDILGYSILVFWFFRRTAVRLYDTVVRGFDAHPQTNERAAPKTGQLFAKHVKNI